MKANGWTMGLVLAGFVALSVLASGCSDSACEAAGKKLCAKACACPSSDNKCHVKLGFVTFGFDNESECKQLFQFSCDGDEPLFADADACKAAAETAMCVARSDPGEMAIEAPLPACAPPARTDGGM